MILVVFFFTPPANVFINYQAINLQSSKYIIITA